MLAEHDVGIDVVLLDTAFLLHQNGLVARPQRHDFSDWQLTCLRTIFGLVEEAS